MSSIIVEQTQYNGVPRLADAITSEIELEINECMSRFPTQDYFCSQGHSFTLTFAEGATPPSFWEYLTCETIAINTPA